MFIGDCDGRERGLSSDRRRGAMEQIRTDFDIGALVVGNTGVSGT